jgi:predicted ATPase/DNA-binding XRE family transcriptional regulator
VRQRRAALGYTRPELAACAGCSVSALRKIEADERRPSRQLAELLAGCLQVEENEKTRFLEAARGVRQVARLGSPAGPATLPVAARFAGPVPAGPAALVAPGGACWNLPAPATPLVGREAELAALSGLLADPDCRLLTLVGPGGIGKTRLAIELSCQLWPRFPGGVFFAPLAATNSPGLIVAAVANAVGLTLSGSREAHHQLMSFLQDKELLLLLDNVEHLLAGVDELATWLAGAPGLKMLVTSRERLELTGEWVFEVQGLPTPGATDPGAAERYSAFQLFLQRAQRAKVDLDLSAEERAAAIRICQLVEGMPLAIELAAAWIPVLSCTEIAHEIEQGLDILATRLRDMPERQRSLRAVFDHSWKLLAGREQAVLRQLSIFRGGFRREAAQAVAGATLDILSALMGSSFLRRTSDGRYSQHELVRHYAGGRLAEQPEEEEAAARGRLSAYYAAFMAGLEEAITGKRQLEALLEIDAEIDNIRAGWQWAVEQRQTDLLLDYTNSMMQFYQIRAWHEEAVQVCSRAIRALDDTEGEGAELLRARLQVHQAVALQYLGEIATAQELLETSRDSARALGSRADIAQALVCLGSGAVFRGDAREGIAYFEEGLSIFEALDDHYGRVWTLQCLGWAAMTINDIALAQFHQNRSLPLLRQHGPPSILGWTLYELGTIHRESGAYTEAVAYLEEAKATCEKLGYHFALLSCFLGLGQTAELVGHYARAQSYYRQAVALRHYLGDATDIGTGLALLTRVTLVLGDEPQAGRTSRELRAFAERSASVIAQGCHEYAMAEVARSQNELMAAEAGFQKSVTILRPTRRGALAILALLRLGQLYLLTGDNDRAEASFHDALQEAWVRSSLPQSLEALVGFSQVRARQGDAEAAGELALLVQSHPASSWSARQQADAALDNLKSGLPEGEVEIASASRRRCERALETVVAELTGVTSRGNSLV